jgi:hypothetical protein
MKHFLMLTVAFSTTPCVAILLLSSPSLQAKDIRQPATVLAATKISLEHDSQVKPAGYCDGGSGCCTCEPVCIPKFRWPWECRAKSKSNRDADCGCAVDACCGDECCGMAPKCGKVKTVKVLEQHKYTYKECGYEWDIKCVCVPKKKHH